MLMFMKIISTIIGIGLCIEMFYKSFKLKSINFAFDGIAILIFILFFSYLVYF